MRDTEGNILQLRYKDAPWKVIIVCILLNRTSRTQVEPIVEVLFKEFSTLWLLADAYKDPDELKKLTEILRPLGFYNQRAKRLSKFAKQVLDVGLTKDTVGDLCGVGSYAKDCYMIMYHGQRFMTCDDGALINYLSRLNREDVINR